MKRKLLLIVLSIACIFCLSFGLAACVGADGGNGEDIPAITSGKRYNDNITYKLLYTSDEECPNGNIDNQKLHTNIDFEARKVYYMAVDFTISSFEMDGWDQSFSISFKIAQSERVGVKLEEVATSNFSEKVEDDVTIITATYSIPENKTEPRTYRMVIRLTFPILDLSKDFITTYFAFYGNNQSNYKYDEKLILLKKSTEGLAFTLLDNEQGYEVSWNNISETDIYIPEFYNGLPVTQIKELGFQQRSSIKNIFIPDTVTTIGNQAFYHCIGLNSITIPSSVTSIGDGAFFDCYNLKAVYIKDIEIWCKISFGNDMYTNPLYYANSLYLNNKLVTELIIPDSITSIGKYAFIGCTSFKSITIPDSVTSIGDDAFNSCTGLESVTFMENSQLTSIDGAFCKCTSLTSITIPDSVTSIGDYTFSGCTRLENITIPDSVTAIGDYAFDYCESLASITIGNAVTSIGDYAFYKCTSLANVTFGESSQLMSIGDNTFDNCVSLTGIALPDSVTLIGNQAFYYCTSLSWIPMPNSVTSIGDKAFYYCKNLAAITIPDSVTFIGSGAFSVCINLKSVIFENTEGWWVSQDIAATSGENILSINLDYPGDAARYLESIFDDYYWHRT